MSPTIKDVALAAGVSVGTVSKVLNKTGTIATATRERVAQVAQTLNFRPNTLAQSLHSGKFISRMPGYDECVEPTLNGIKS